MTKLNFLSVAPVYAVDRVEKSVAWYEEKLGFEVIDVAEDPQGHEPASYAVLEKNEVSLHLIRRADAKEGFRGHADAQFNVFGELDEAFEQLQSMGVEILQPPQDQPWGSRDFIIADLDGNKIWISTIE